MNALYEHENINSTEPKPNSGHWVTISTPKLTGCLSILAFTSYNRQLKIRKRTVIVTMGTEYERKRRKRQANPEEFTTPSSHHGDLPSTRDWLSCSPCVGTGEAVTSLAFIRLGRFTSHISNRSPCVVISVLSVTSDSLLFCLINW